MNDLKTFHFIDECIKEAEKAYEMDEVPVGCIIVKDNKTIAKAHNFSKSKQNLIKHAEILASEKALKKLENDRLTGCEIYVTLEPCLMCFAALNLLKPKSIIFVVNDEKFGYSNFINNEKISRFCSVFKTNYREKDIKNLMHNFFSEKR